MAGAEGSRMSDTDSQASASRATTISLFGKSDQEVRFRVDDLTFDLIQKMAHMNGMTANDFARLKLLIAVHGISHVNSLAQELVARVASSGQDGA